jgi:Leucine-rich repeat (LRR) protein
MILQEKPMTWLRTKAFCGCLVLLALSACNRDGQKAGSEAPRVPVRPVYQGLDAATVAAYEKLGAIYGTMGTVAPFRKGREKEEKGLPGFRFLSFPKAKLPEVGAPFGLDLESWTQEGLKELAGLPNLTALTLSRSSVATSHLKELARCKSLSTLNLFYAKVTDQGWRELAGLKSLTTLSLVGTNLTPAGLKEVAKCKGLSTLNLVNIPENKGKIKRKWKVKDTGVEMEEMEHDARIEMELKELAGLPNLTSLSLIGMAVTDAELLELSSCKNLAELSLGDSAWVPGLLGLAGLKSRAARDLNILGTVRGVGLTDELLHLLCNIGLMHILSVAGGEGFARPRSTEEIVSLNLSHSNTVTPVGLKALARLKNLNTLYLDKSEIPGVPVHLRGLVDEDLRVLREIGLLHALSYANGKDGARPRSAEEVISLDLTSRHTTITDAGLKELAGLKNLTTLRLRRILGLSAAGIDELRKALPQCDVSSH